MKATGLKIHTMVYMSENDINYYRLDVVPGDIRFLLGIDAEITLEVAESIGLYGADYTRWRESANL